MNKYILIVVIILLLSNVYASGMPVFDPASSTALAEADIPLEQGNLFRLKNEKCVFAGKTIKQSNQAFLDIRKAVCGEYEISLESKYAKYEKPISAGEVVKIPVGLIDFIAEQIKEAEDIRCQNPKGTGIVMGNMALEPFPNCKGAAVKANQNKGD